MGTLARSCFLNARNRLYHWCFVLLGVFFPGFLPFGSTFSVAHPPCREQALYPPYVYSSLSPLPVPWSCRCFAPMSVWMAIVSTWSILHLEHLECKERKKTENPREGWEDGTPPPHRDFKERGVVLGVQKERKKENRQPKGGMGGRHAATTQGF